jgi:hypothetical protein
VYKRVYESVKFTFKKSENTLLVSEKFDSGSENTRTQTHTAKQVLEVRRSDFQSLLATVSPRFIEKEKLLFAVLLHNSALKVQKILWQQADRVPVVNEIALNTREK